MDILLSALDSGADSVEESATNIDDPEFVELVLRATRRIVALGTEASVAEINAAALAVIQDVAQFTLAWAEPEGAVPQPLGDARGTTLQSDEKIRAERRW